MNPVQHELCHYKIEHWQQDYQYPGYLKTWHKENSWFTNDARLPKNTEHHEYKLIKLNKPVKKEFINLL